MFDYELRVLPGAEALADAAAQEVVLLLASALLARGSAALVLAGGSTPRTLYRRLAEEPYRSGIKWEKVRFLFGDERCVPPDHPDSNYRMARETLLDVLNPPEDHIARIRGEDPPEPAARDYTIELGRHLSACGGRPDIVLLGLGEDGHTASLFPGTDALSNTTHGAAAVYVPRLGKWRVTMTIPLLNEARTVMFLAAGAGKRDMVRRVLSAADRDADVPATLVRPREGDLLWMLDASAAPEPGQP